MKIIRLQIERKWRGRSLQTIKHAVSLDPKKHPQIRHFLHHVSKLCELGDGPNELSIDGFAFSPTDRSKILREGVVYKFKIDVNGCPKFERAREEKISKLIKSSSSEGEDEEEVEESQEEEMEEEKRSKKGKVQAKGKSQLESFGKVTNRKNKKEQAERKGSSSGSDSSVSSDSSSSSSSSSSQSQEAPAPRKIKKTEARIPAKKEKSVPSKQEKHVTTHQPSKPVPKETKQLKKKQEPIVEKKTTQKKAVPAVPASESSQSSESLSDQLPHLGQKTTKPVADVPTQSKAQVDKKTMQQAAQRAETVAVNPSALKKRIIEDSSEEEIEKPLQKEEKQTPKIKINTNVKLPPALRNKIAQKQVQKPKINAWLSITKEKMQKWQQGGEKYFCKPKNRIRFKIIELDEERFVPVKSGWISGEVKDVTADGRVQLVNVDQEGKGYRQHYEIPEHNMDELQINRAEATPEQILCLQGEEKATQKIEESKKEQEQKKQVAGLQSGDKDAKAICGQVQFYFSDKSYLTDLYTQMHANRHPEKYVNISFLLNFPKIKKLIRDESKLFQYLKDDEKYASRSYEIDFENKLIRKKNIVPLKPAAPEESLDAKPEEKPSENRENAG